VIFLAICGVILVWELNEQSAVQPANPENPKIHFNTSFKYFALSFG